MEVNKIVDDAQAHFRQCLDEGLPTWFNIVELGATHNEQVQKYSRVLRAILDNPEIWDDSQRSPCALPSWVAFHYALGSLYLYCNRIFKVEGLYTDEQMKLLVMDAFDAERRRFERLANRFSYQAELSPQRPRIPESVRVFVWQRDQGKCARCGSRERLEYDHIIPIVKGGGNTARNIELLCEECNRKKGSSVE